MGTLQASAATLVFDWQFESSKLQPAQATCSVHLVPRGKKSRSKKSRKKHRKNDSFSESEDDRSRSEDTTKAKVGNATTDSRKCSLDELATIATAITFQNNGGES